VQRRRRFLKVRTANGVEGWTDERQLLGKDDMESLRELTSQVRRMLPQGQATTFGELNVHTQPSRQSPSFIQVKEGEKVDVLMHRAVPRTDLPRKPLIPPAPKKKKAAEKKPKEEPNYPPPPVPKPPSPPPNWLDLSKTDLEEAVAASEDQDVEKEPVPVPMDDWSLIRLSNGTSGWALTRRLVMAIPDEVAQYAEGRRIVSYFPLGEVDDGGQKKHNWLWTTIGGGTLPYDFESFRVFIWSLRRHRYETAYIDRNIRGYAPIVLEEVELAAPGKGKGAPATSKYPGFSICMERGEGGRRRREYAFIANIVRYAGERPCEAPPPATQKAPSSTGIAVAQEPQAPASESFTQRFKQRLKAMARGWFGR